MINFNHQQLKNQHQVQALLDMDFTHKLIAKLSLKQLIRKKSLRGKKMMNPLYVSPKCNMYPVFDGMQNHSKEKCDHKNAQVGAVYQVPSISPT